MSQSSEFSQFLPPTIPVRGSSSKFATYSSLRSRLVSAKQSQENLEQSLKRKASQLSTLNTGTLAEDEATGDFLDEHLKHSAILEDQLKISKAAFNELFRLNEISKNEFLTNIRDISQKQAKLFAGDVTIKRYRERLLGNIGDMILEAGKNEAALGKALSVMLLKIISPKAVHRDLEQQAFRRNLIAYYGSSPDRNKRIWCPVLQAWGRNRRAAHLVPYKLGYHTVGDIFGEPDNGHILLWSMGNGLMLDPEVERAFDEYRFCLLPVPRQDEPDGWKLVLLDESIRFEEVTDNISKTWNDLDGKELKFLNSRRPQRRFLYFHYCIAMIKTMSHQIQGWENARDKTKTGRLWATPGPYLRTSMLKKLALHIGDVEIPQELIAGHEIDEGPLAPGREETDVKDLAWMALDDELPPIEDHVDDE